MLYKNVYIDTTCLYMPEIREPLSIRFASGKDPCVAHLPDIERGFESVEAAKKFIDRNLKRIKKKCDEDAKKNGIPF